MLAKGDSINPQELEMAIDMGFDMIVAPGNVMGGYGEGVEFVKIAHAENRFVAPAVFTPTELGYFIEREDGNEPDAIKVFPARSHGPKGLADLLAPLVVGSVDPVPLEAVVDRFLPLVDCLTGWGVFSLSR